MLFPCADRPYIDLISVLSQGNTLSFSLKQVLFYNLIFVFPLLTFSALLFFLVRSGKTEAFLQKNFIVIDFIIGIVLIFIGVYFIHNRIKNQMLKRQEWECPEKPQHSLGYFLRTL